MRKAEFFVPEALVTQFASSLVERNLKGSIAGTTEKKELIIEVKYEKHQTENVDKLEELLKKLIRVIL
jgi:hypothetical protein